MVLEVVTRFMWRADQRSLPYAKFSGEVECFKDNLFDYIDGVMTKEKAPEGMYNLSVMDWDKASCDRDWVHYRIRYTPPASSQ